MSRFRTLDSLAPMDEDVRALMADIDASLADLEKHLESARSESEPAAKPAEASPDQPKPEATPTPAAEPEAVSAPPPVEAGGFLAELERETRVAAGTGRSVAETQAADARLIHEALGRVFQFFNSLCRYANALAPTIERVYRLDGQIAFTELKWRDAATRSRQQSLRERALLDYVVFRVSLVAPAPVAVVRRWDQMEALRKDMHILDLREVEGIEGGDELAQGLVRMHLAADFPVQVTFRANYSRNRIDLLSRNLEGFGIAAFTCAPADISQQFLDDLGRFLLARASKLPPGLNRVHCRAEL